MKLLRNLTLASIFGTAFGMGAGQAMSWMLTLTV